MSGWLCPIAWYTSSHWTFGNSPILTFLLLIALAVGVFNLVSKLQGYDEREKRKARAELIAVATMACLGLVVFIVALGTQRNPSRAGTAAVLPSPTFHESATPGETK